MKMIRIQTVTVLFAVAVLAWAASAQAGAVKLRYGFKTGAIYAVVERYQDVGKSVTQMNIMGKNQTVETPMDQASEGEWKMKASGGPGGAVKLTTTYGTHKGGERWAAGKADAGSFFADSRAEIVVDTVKGPVSYAVTPQDPIVDIVYRARFAWMPRLPDGSLKEGDSFTHEYVLSSGMYNVKTTEEYVLAQIKGNYVTFDVQTKQIAQIRMSQAQAPAGMPAGMGMSDMTVAYKGKGSATFDIKDGLFTEREGTMAYSNLEGVKGSSPMPGQMNFETRMQGTMRYSVVTEKQ